MEGTWSLQSEHLNMCDVLQGSSSKQLSSGSAHHLLLFSTANAETETQPFPACLALGRSCSTTQQLRQESGMPPSLLLSGSRCRIEFRFCLVACRHWQIAAPTPRQHRSPPSGASRTSGCSSTRRAGRRRRRGRQPKTQPACAARDQRRPLHWQFSRRPLSTRRALTKPRYGREHATFADFGGGGRSVGGR